MKVPANRQRLIFQGKLLNNFENLQALRVSFSFLLEFKILSQFFKSKIENGHVFHLIALPNNVPVGQNEPNSQQNNNLPQNINPPQLPNQEIEFLNGVFRTISSFQFFKNFFHFKKKKDESSNQRRNVRRRVMQQRANGY